LRSQLQKKRKKKRTSEEEWREPNKEGEADSREILDSEKRRR